MQTELSAETLARLQAEFDRDPRNRVLANAVAKVGFQDVALNQQPLRDEQFTFSLELTAGKVTAQKSSGRCWLFAGLNTFRQAIMEKLNLETFELSQNYQMFWDKMEKANYFLESILKTLDEPTNGRLIAWLLTGPVQDGGQWDMFVNLVNKHGVVPKYAMPETFHAGNTRYLVGLLTTKLREDALRLREAYAQGTGLDDLRIQKDAMLADIYRMLVEALGQPPETFCFEYRDKDDAFHRDADLTPQAFMAKYVDLDVDAYVSLINAPTADKPYDRTYTVKFLGNVVGGKDVLYLNVPSAVQKQAAIAQMQAGEPVWFGCDVGKYLDGDSGVLSLDMFDYEGVCGTTFGMNKAERLDYGQSLMTHAMVLQGVNLVDGEPNRWKVENSWGEERGHKGYLIMNDGWFDAYLYQIVVHKKYLPAELVEALDQAPIALEPWDPMGSLA